MPPSNDDPTGSLSKSDADLNHLARVEKSPLAFNSRLVSLVSLPAGSLFARITSATPVPQSSYSTVQVSETGHVELNSDLRYCNHSCDPSLVFDVDRLEVRVSPHKALAVDDALTFFYPSTEWEMAQPFRCDCGAGEGRCKGWIGGAKLLTKGDFEGHFVSEHVARLMEREKGKGSEENL